MPPDFYKNVLELEKEVDKHKENCSETLLKGLTTLYSEAIEFFGYKDQLDKCAELQMRMQSILVKPYVLECLNRFERQRLEEEARQEAQNPTERIVFASTKVQLQKLYQEKLQEKERQSKLKKVEIITGGDHDDEPENSEDESRSTHSSEEDQFVDLDQAMADIDAIEITPKSSSHRVFDFLKFEYEATGRIELPWYIEAKKTAKREAPVKKTHEKRDYKGL